MAIKTFIFGHKIETGLKGSTIAVTQELERSLSRLFKGAVNAFLREILGAMETDTGMSTASLQPLAARVRTRTQVIEAARGFGPRRWYKDYSDYGFGGDDTIYQFKSRALGERLGRESYIFDITGTKAVFKFKYAVLQHYLLDAGVVESRGGLSRGKAAFEAYVKLNWKRELGFKNLLSLALTGKSIRVKAED